MNVTNNCCPRLCQTFNPLLALRNNGTLFFRRADPQRAQTFEALRSAFWDFQSQSPQAGMSTAARAAHMRFFSQITAIVDPGKRFSSETTLENLPAQRSFADPVDWKPKWAQRQEKAARENRPANVDASHLRNLEDVSMNSHVRLRLFGSSESGKQRFQAASEHQRERIHFGRYSTLQSCCFQQRHTLRQNLLEQRH
eukprot:GABV01009672.1.p1 GENE.GABV01009672.1~~GABV01009672.1.p1  ORF type:complete len:208 (+),score=20.09 GABV01009672.1:34-624(+)